MADKSPSNIAGMTLSELSVLAENLDLPKFTARQLADWVYKKRCSDINSMTNISAAGRQKLLQHCSSGLKRPIKTSISADGTKKYLFEVGEGQFVESVFIPDKDRSTLCISSQVGCRMGCRFCATGRMGFARNLSAGEILNQVLSIDESPELDNIVYMGMGEPLDNTAEVLKSIEILCSDYGLAMSPKRITVSTVGRPEGLKALLEGCKCHVAVSIHAANSELRAELVPSERTGRIADIMAMLKQYDWTHQRRISFEYTMLQGVNDSAICATELSKMVKSLPCRVNLIPYHKAEGFSYLPSSAETIEKFKSILEKNKITTTIRRSRGQDIDAACGMLSTKHKQTK